jgi:hypothetical protein
VWLRATKEYSLILNELHIDVSHILILSAYDILCSSLRMREYSLAVRDHTAMIVLITSSKQYQAKK